MATPHLDAYLAQSMWNRVLCRHPSWPSWNEAVEYFKIKKGSIAEFARKLGISRQAGHYVFNRFLRRACRLTGTVIQKHRLEKIKEEKKISRLKPETQELFKWLKLNYMLEILPHESGAQNDRLLINGRRCHVHILHSKFVPNERMRRAYVHASISDRTLRKLYAIIVITNVKGYKKRIFVIPAREILKEKNKNNDCNPDRIYQIYLPLIKRRKYTRRSGLNFWKFENAFHLFD